ncbi:hypothetical protein JYK00_01875 [Thermosipho ferrireducens]|uniref:FAD-binding FR-type domain-containing protein n=1 Tax=Thermosipho ferrireducens TaxID=2571116 RepID=A0ABX7SAJ8_9BACT|nr:FAD-binding oxidoreductase [Thermosipho ferrireducens]QTA38310.1 hypothetical protein JYK00_01875 [Thermosipho ferrireducens]
MKSLVTKIQTTENYIIMEVETEHILKIEPGQFVMINIKGFVFPKPFSPMDQKGKKMVFLIAVVGEMTSEMKKLKPGDHIEIRGPLGTPFIEKIDRNRQYILIGGDCGSAPLIHFKNIYPELVKKEIYGFVTPEIKQILTNDNLHIDKVEGMSPLKKVEKFINKDDAILICGSTNFIKAAKKKFKDYLIYGSLEERMGCGIGMCKGCPVKTKSGIKMICKDGPIFNLSEVELEW